MKMKTHNYLEKEKNCLGELMEDDLKIYQNHSKVIIPLNSIKKTSLYKRQKFHKNYIFFFSTLAIIFCFNSFVIRQPFFSLLTQSLVAFILTFIITDYQYTYIIVKEHGYIALKIKKTEVNDAKKLQRKINERIRQLKEKELIKLEAI